MWCIGCEHGHAPNDDGKCPCCSFQLVKKDIEGTPVPKEEIVTVESMKPGVANEPHKRLGNYQTQQGSAETPETLVKKGSASTPNAGSKGEKNAKRKGGRPRSRKRKSAPVDTTGRETGSS